jgi:hypothetical protein
MLAGPAEVLMDESSCPNCGREMLRIDALHDDEVVESVIQCPDGHVFLERRDERGELVVLAIA